MSWVDSRTPTFLSRAIRPRRAAVSCVLRGSRLASGSSRSRSCGRDARACAIRTLCCSPPDRPDPGIGEVGGVDGSEKLVDPGALGARHYREAQPSPVHPELDEVPCTYRKIRVEDYLLGHITDRAPSEMPTRHSHLARRDRQEPENRPQQGRLPGPVFSYEAGERPCRNRKRHSA